MQEIGVEEARKVLGDLVTGVANGGKPVVVTKNGVPAAALIGHEQLRHLPTPHDRYAAALSARETAVERGLSGTALAGMDMYIARLRGEVDAENEVQQAELSARRAAVLADLERGDQDPAPRASS